MDTSGANPATVLESARQYLARQASHDPHPKTFIHETRKHALELLLTRPGNTTTPGQTITDAALARLLIRATDTTTFNRITSSR
jgi:hypothetical protein